MSENQARRDAALGRLRRINRRIAAGSVVGTGALLALIATDAHAAHQKVTPTRASSATPAQTPAAGSGVTSPGAASSAGSAASAGSTAAGSAYPAPAAAPSAGYGDASSGAGAASGYAAPTYSPAPVTSGAS